MSKFIRIPFSPGRCGKLLPSLDVLAQGGEDPIDVGGTVVFDAMNCWNSDDNKDPSM